MAGHLEKAADDKRAKRKKEKEKEETHQNLLEKKDF